jgi:hypothetical protein
MAPSVTPSQLAALEARIEALERQVPGNSWSRYRVVELLKHCQLYVERGVKEQMPED